MQKIMLSMATVATLLTASEVETKIDAKEEVEAKIEASKTESSFLDRIHFKADLRLRYESIERDDTTNDYRERYRLRLGTTIDLTDNFVFEAGMRSGFGNPTSGNQTFEDDMPLKDYFFESLRVNVLDVAYKFDESTVKVGRQLYMMYRPIESQLVWDNDLSLNGVNYNYTDDNKMITVGINRPSWEEEAVSQDDVNLFIAQYVQTTKLENAKLNLGIGFNYYDGLKGNTPLFGKSMGNTLVDGVYANDYHILDGFAELQFKDVFGKPFKMAASVAYNTAADDNNFGYDLGVQLGKAENPGEWEVKYSYTDIQEDAVFGGYCDSDNFGGGTAAKGHAIRTKYKYLKNVDFAGSFFFNTLYASKSKTGVEADYERVQLDVIFKF